MPINELRLVVARWYTVPPTRSVSAWRFIVFEIVPSHNMGIGTHDTYAGIAGR